MFVLVVLALVFPGTAVAAAASVCRPTIIDEEVAKVFAMSAS